jgi:hypothetical protein
VIRFSLFGYFPGDISFATLPGIYAKGYSHETLSVYSIARNVIDKSLV